MPPRTSRDLTRVVREIEQRLPRNRPSLPAVSMERVDGKEAAMRAKARLETQANPQPLAIPQRRHIVEERVEHVSAGVDRSRAPRQRALTLVERLYDGGFIDHDEVGAARAMRDLYLREVTCSEGVSSYGDPRGSGAPWEKGDRKAAEVARRRSNRRQLAGLMFAMCGLKNQEGLADFDRELFEILQRSCVATVDAPTLATIGAARSEYGSEKQRTAVGATVLREALRRGAIYLGLIHADPWLEEKSLQITGDVVK